MAGLEVVNENESVPEDETFPDSEKTERLIHFPITRIKNIIKLDPDVTLASRDAVVMIAKAAELFVQTLAKEAYLSTKHTKRKTVQRRDFDEAVDRADAFAFLEGALDF